MIGLLSGVRQGSEEVLALKEWIVSKDLIVRGACGKQFQDIRHAHAHPTNAGPPAALADFDRYS